MSFTISAFAARPMASGIHHPETRRAERFPKIPTGAPRAVRACGKKSGEIHDELKEKFTTGGACPPSPRLSVANETPRIPSTVINCLAPIADARVHEHTGGGYKGFCDYEEIKAAIKECDGLDGARLEACYAEFGCDVDRVTEHYARAAGIEKKQGKA